MLKVIARTWVLLIPFACAEGPPPDQAEDMVMDTLVVDTVVQDQIEYTLEQTPEAPVESAPLEKVIEPARPAVAPPPPTNVAPAAITSTSPSSDQEISQQGPSHVAWSTLLAKHVSGTGEVDYTGFRNDMDELNAYLSTLSQEVPDNRWSRPEALAYWINAYNAFTIKLVLDNWPVNSIREIDQPWDTKFITLDGQNYSLNQIEHEIIRENFAEPRIHFALVCAAVSCPPLASTAYTADNLDKMLDRRTRSFINDETFNVTQEEVVRVSPLFDWYAEDFEDVPAYLNRYLTTDIPAKKELHFLEYDWSLND